MFLLYINRKGETHILNFRMSDGNFRFLCGKTWSRFGRYMTLAADDTFSGICPTCKKLEENAYRTDLEYNLSFARNAVQNGYYTLRDFHQNEMLGPRDVYEYLEKKSGWPKLLRLQRQATRKKKNV